MTKYRISVSLSEQVYNEVQKISERTGQSLSSIGKQLITQQIDTMAMAIEIMQDKERFEQVMAILKASDNK